MSIHGQIHKRLTEPRANTIVIHQNPDGDALGSAGAMAEWLLQDGKDVKIYCATPFPENLRFLAHTDMISADAGVLAGAENIIVLDSGDLRYAGLANLKRELDPVKIINIDHHVSNEKYGFMNLVDHEASATAQILYNFFRANRVAINHLMATALLTGLVGDTDNFTNAGTTPEAMKAAGDLLRCGANLPLVHRWVVKNSSLNLLKLWGVVLERLEKIEEKNLAYTYITNNDYLLYGVDELGAEGIANLLNKLGGVKISLLIRETPEGKIKGSLRTTNDDTDVAALAKKLGGGGHKKAAGFTTEGTIDDVLNKILTME